MRRPKGITYLNSQRVPNREGKLQYTKKVINDEPEIIEGLVGNAYASSALKIIDYNREVIEQAKSRIMPLSLENIRAGMRRGFKELPEECYRRFMTDGVMEKYREWMEEPYEMSSYKPEGRRIDAGRGIFVRSRPEMKFVEKFYQFHVPYRYEQIIIIDGYDLAPDFTFPSRTGEPFYLEYCGMMDDPKYLEHYLWKRRMYESAGITEWRNMIYVFDRGCEIDMPRIENIIKGEILPRL